MSQSLLDFQHTTIRVLIVMSDILDKTLDKKDQTNPQWSMAQYCYLFIY